MMFDAHITLRKTTASAPSDFDPYTVAYAFEGGGEIHTQPRATASEALFEYLRAVVLYRPTGGSLEAGLRYDNPAFLNASTCILSDIPAQVPSTAESLGHIRHYLSLTLADLARILLVRRPTIYAWLDETQEPRDANLRRLRRLSQFVDKLRTRIDQPIGAALRQPLIGGVSLLDVLSAEVLEEDSMSRILEQLPRVVVTARKGRPARLRAIGTAKSSVQQEASLRQAIRKHSRRNR